MTPTHALEREEPWDLRPEAPGGRAGARLQGPGATAESWSPQQPGGHVPEGLPGEGLEGLAVQKIPVENPRVAASDGQMPAGFCDSGNTSPVGASLAPNRAEGTGAGSRSWPRRCPQTLPQPRPPESRVCCAGCPVHRPSWARMRCQRRCCCPREHLPLSLPQASGAGGQAPAL